MVDPSTAKTFGKWSLREEYRVPLTDAHFDILLNALDDGQGMIDVADFIGRL